MELENLRCRVEKLEEMVANNNAAIAKLAQALERVSYILEINAKSIALINLRNSS